MSEVVNCNLTKEYLLSKKTHPIYVKLPLVEFEEYEKYSNYIPENMEKNYKKLEQKYLEKLSFDYKDKIEKVKNGIKINQNFYNKLVEKQKSKFADVQYTQEQKKEYFENDGNFLRKIFLELLIREWGEEGKEEREKSYGQVIPELKKYLDYEKPEEIKNKKVLIPKNHFGRLAYELSKLGYNIDFLEDYYVYLITQDYLFNTSEKFGDIICPRIHSFCSSFNEKSVTKQHKIPDEDIKNDLKNKNLVIYQEDFMKFFKGKKDLYDAVVTVFCTEDIKNMVEYIEIVHEILNKGGVWINLGSMANNYANYGGLALAWNEMRQVILNYDFEFKREEKQVVPYLSIEGNSLPHTVGIIFFTVMKK